jgi:hypothetical protein
VIIRLRQLFLLTHLTSTRSIIMGPHCCHPPSIRWHPATIP